MMLLFLLENKISWGVTQLGWVLFIFLILEIMKCWRLYFQGNNYIAVDLFWKEKLKVVMMIVNTIKLKILYYINVSLYITNILKSFVNIIVINTHVNYNLQFIIYYVLFFLVFYFTFESHDPPGFNHATILKYLSYS